MISNNYTVTSTAVKILAGAPMERTVYIHVLSAGTIYMGNASVTTANGFLTEKNAVPTVLVVPPHEEVWAIGTGTEDVRVLRPTADGN